MWPEATDPTSSVVDGSADSSYKGDGTTDRKEKSDEAMATVTRIAVELKPCDQRKTGSPRQPMKTVSCKSIRLSAHRISASTTRFSTSGLPKSPYRLRRQRSNHRRSTTKNRSPALRYSVSVLIFFRTILAEIVYPYPPKLRRPVKCHSRPFFMRVRRTKRFRHGYGWPRLAPTD